tara:strand:- start:91 stop:480 length:390 start_codon:yes stop_codon:yes gene_type:complete
MLDKINEYTKTVNILKKELEEYIVDKNIPLQERWDLWLLAPDSLKNHGDWISAASKLTHYDATSQWRDRYQTYTFEQTPWDMLDNADVPLEDTPDEDRLVEYLEEYVPEGIEFLESVLEHNLGSYCHDW